MRLFVLDTSADSLFPFVACVQTAKSWYIRLAFGDSEEVLGKQTTLSHSFNVADEILC